MTTRKDKRRREWESFERFLFYAFLIAFTLLGGGFIAYHVLAYMARNWSA